MNTPKILIVEDELLIAKDISIILEKEGYETTFGVTNVTDAISKIELYEFHLILIDISLNGSKDGINLGHYLLKRDTIPFIYITSNTDNFTLEEVKVTRPYGIIIKPFKAIDIKSSVSIILNNFKYKNIDSFRKHDEIVKDDVPFILKSVIQYIDENIQNKIEIKELSSMTRWTHNHFIKVFTNFINKTPYQYILDKKIEKAKFLVANTDLTFTDISFELGFSSYSNFCNAFKKVTNKTPENFRKFNYIKSQLK